MLSGCTRMHMYWPWTGLAPLRLCHGTMVSHITVSLIPHGVWFPLALSFDRLL